MFTLNFNERGVSAYEKNKFSTIGCRVNGQYFCYDGVYRKRDGFLPPHTLDREGPDPAGIETTLEAAEPQLDPLIEHSKSRGNRSR